MSLQNIQHNQGKFLKSLISTAFILAAVPTLYNVVLTDIIAMIAIYGFGLKGPLVS